MKKKLVWLIMGRGQECILILKGANALFKVLGPLVDKTARYLKKGEVFELEKQEGGHELKEKEVGEDPDSQIQHKPWPVPLEMKATLSMWLQVLRLHDPRVLGCYSRREANRLGSMVEDEEAMSKAASSVEVVGVRLKHPYVVPATRW
ncbi:hypothetical protein F2Q68_00033790 [Brassica cretica]|uniref:Uncharacterized protein n=1 Tax=Brassica cretica TaxID=69181 RepID=A0A8S9GZG4_BRACR|nr:hypothetical protein F2Q68_00033790 [Brassica cretica]